MLSKNDHREKLASWYTREHVERNHDASLEVLRRGLEKLRAECEQTELGWDSPNQRLRRLETERRAFSGNVSFSAPSQKQEVHSNGTEVPPSRSKPVSE
jgi:hypothetical protein